jgi:hypothetical protein
MRGSPARILCAELLSAGPVASPCQLFQLVARAWLSSCRGARHGLGLGLPPAARAVARAWTRLGMLRIGTRGALSNHSGPTPSRRAPRHRRPYRALADGVRAAAKAKGQAWRLHPAVAHARPAGGGRLTLWRVGPHAAPHSVTISPRSDSAGRRFSSARRNHRSASAA